jgi:anti-sigma B factor antagonist
MAKQGEMKLVHVNETVMEIFEVTGFSEILTIE